MGNTATLDSVQRALVNKTDSPTSRNPVSTQRDLEDGGSTLPEVTTQTASFGYRMRKQVSFDELSMRSAKDLCMKEELVPAKVANPLHPVVADLARRYPGPMELLMPAQEGADVVYQFKKTGSTYQGEVLDSKPDGRGIIVTTKGAMIQGLFEKGAMKGAARIIDPNGTVYIGHIENRLKNGKGFYRESGGCTIDADWLNGVTNGFVVVRAPNGQTIFEGTTIAGKRHGFGKLRNLIQKFTYEGEFRDDMFNGEGIKIFDSGKVYRGNFRNGLECGYGELQTIDGRTIKAHFENGVPRGPGILVTNELEHKEVIF